MSAFPDPNPHNTIPRPADGSIWIDGANKAYVVRYTTRLSVYCKHAGREHVFPLGEFLNEMCPVEELLEVFNDDYPV